MDILKESMNEIFFAHFCDSSATDFQPPLIPLPPLPLASQTSSPTPDSHH